MIIIFMHTYFLIMSRKQIVVVFFFFSLGNSCGNLSSVLANSKTLSSESTVGFCWWCCYLLDESFSHLPV